MYDRWFAKYTHSLQGRRVAVVGATGGIGVHLCRHLARLEAQLILLGRSRQKNEDLMAALRREFPALSVEYIPLDLEDAASVDAAAEALSARPLHVLIHNAGIYAVPRYETAQGVDNVFTVNCLSPYRLTRLLEPALAAAGGRVVVVGSIAHNYSRIDPDDVDFSAHPEASLAYGNAKRHLMLAMYRHFEGVKDITLSVVHPGITFTNITAHYPKWLFALIKYPMKLVFMPPRRAALSVLRGVFEPTAYGEWIGPRLLDVWGLPRKRTLRTFTAEEAEVAYRAVEALICV